MSNSEQERDPAMLNSTIHSLPTAQLIAHYNAAAKALNKPLVKRFADRKTAEKRTAAILMQAEKGSVKRNLKTMTAKELAAEALKAVKPETKKAKAPKHMVDEEFGCREGTNRWNLLAALRAAKGSAVPQSQLLKAVYGAGHKEYRAPLSMVMKGLQMAIKANKLPYHIDKTRENKELYFALKSKS